MSSQYAFLPPPLHSILHTLPPTLKHVSNFLSDNVVNNNMPYIRRYMDSNVIAGCIANFERTCALIGRVLTELSVGVPVDYTLLPIAE
jgi:hypothetical protein